MGIAPLVTIAVAILLYGAVSARLERSIVTPPMAFVLLGIVVGPYVLWCLQVDFESTAVHLLAEFTLVVVLFTDASRIDLGLLRRERGMPIRLLAIGLPLTIAAGTLAATLIFEEFSIWEAAVLAAILAPTDAALGQAVVTSKLVPLRVRQALNTESGLNDGIMLPVLLIFASFAATGEGESAGYWFAFTAKQVIFGPLVGALVGFFGGKLVERATAAGWMSQAFQQLSSISLALLAFGAAELVHGNGFIAAFVAGLTLGNFCKGVSESLYEFAEAEGQLLTLMIFLVFGAAMMPVALHGWNWMALVYALLSLTVVRMVPVAISLLGTRLHPSTFVFLGWFGPRGIASILFTLLILEEHLRVSETLLVTVIVTVFLSVFAHGMTAVPAAAWYARRVAACEQQRPEREPMDQLSYRRPKLDE